MQTWLSPIAAVWRCAYPSAAIPFKQLAQKMAPLMKAHPPDRVCIELAAYLKKTPAQYLNLAKFAATFGSWAVPEPLSVRPEPVAPTTKRVVSETAAGRYRLQEVGLDDPRPAA